MRRRARRGRMFILGLLFIMYSAINVYSSSDTGSGSSNSPRPDIEQNDPSSTLLPKSTIDDVTAFGSTESTQSTTGRPTTTSTQTPNGRPTLRPKRWNCTPPAIEQFPPPLLPSWFREKGGLIIHVLIAIFTFLGLAIVCDDYFVSSLDRICEELRLSPDVAGATFMAAGSSAPELGTVIIGVFFAKDDIGVSGVIGSAVFNIMFVISVCALFSGTVCHLNWWPLVRDCFFYSLSIIVMLIIMLNDYISWYEALIMILFYVLYCVALHFNSALERWAYSLKLPIKLPTKEEQSALVTFKNVSDQNYSVEAANGSPEQQATSPDQQPQQQPQQQQQQNYQGYGTDWDPNAAWDDGQGNAPSQTSNLAQNAGGYGVTDSWNPDASWGQGQQNYAYTAATGDQTDQMNSTNGEADATASTQNTPQNKVGALPAPEFYKSKDPKASQMLVDPLIRPTEGGAIALITWRVCYPIHYLCQKTVPDCRTEKYRNWYGFTFIISMLWISFYSYLMVWMITIIGTTLGIPDTVMGLTFVAAGVSIPDALSSMAVIKEGYGDMAVSNAVGSNVFDILICLGLPWLIQTTIIDAGGHVNVISKGLTYSTLSLLSTVVFLLLSVHLNGWKLDRRLGAILMVWYFLFIALASMYELNVFGNFNPPQCPSDY